MVNLILFKYKCMNKVNILTIRYLLPIKKNQLGIVLHQLDILIIHVWLCKKRSICISNNTLLKPDEVILDLFQKIKGLGILCGEIEQDFFPCNFLYRATVLLILGGTVSLSQGYSIITTEGQLPCQGTRLSSCQSPGPYHCLSHGRNTVTNNGHPFNILISIENSNFQII